MSTYLGNAPVYLNVKKIQDITSNYCGLFAALFALLFDGKKLPGRGRIRFFTDPRRLRKNDVKCVQYLKRIK